MVGSNFLCQVEDFPLLASFQHPFYPKTALDFAKYISISDDINNHMVCIPYALNILLE